ncbi:unnamed protein product [Urochloa decumbens]|uniref:FBD domain-containing protein n=1 Tax=Urochloa decumbens TaxID=240449 RepID=A0ABC9FW30_9POAL
MTACRDCQRYQSEPPRRRGGRRLQPKRLRLSDDYGGEEDRLSALPDELLLDVLARLRCARAAARAGLLARRWRGLWTRLGALVFHTTPLDPLLAALARIAGPVGSLDIAVPEHRRRQARPTPARISLLLCAAAGLAPAKLSLCIWSEFAAVELPLFDRATDIALRVRGGRFTLPAAGDFPVLDTLSLDCRHIDFVDLLPRCPRLRELWICDREQGSVTVHSESLEELDVYTFVQLQRIDIVAPGLKKLRLNASDGINRSEFTLSFLAPALEEFTWQCSCHSSTDTFGMAWRLDSLNLQTRQVIPGQNQLATNSESSSVQLQRRSHVHVLWLYICPLAGWSGAEQNFGQEISRFLFTKFSVLELYIRTGEHVYGDMVLHLLGLCTFIRKLNLITVSTTSWVSKPCSLTCPCDQPKSWRSQSISLTELKEIDIQGFDGKDHEIDLLEVLLRCATMLERVTLRLSSKVSQSDSDGYLKLNSLLKAYPSVECKFSLT